MIDKGVCDKGYAWNPSSCECKCDKSCDVGEYLDYGNCKCRKRLVDKLVDECDKIVEEVKILDKNEDKCCSCILHIVLFQYFLQLMFELLLILFTTNTWIVIKKLLVDMIMFIKQQFD